MSKSVSPPNAASENRMMRLMGLGHPLLDIISHVDKEYLNLHRVELGSVNLANPEQLPIFEELSQNRDVEFVPGGASMNATRVTRWMLGDAPEVSCCWVGCIGDDEFGCILERALNKGGVRSFFQRQDEQQTGTCACMIVDKERSLLANLGAAVEITMDHILSEEVTEAMANSDIFYFEGFFLNTVSSPHNSIHIGKHCVTHNKVFTYNLNAPYLCHAFKDRWMEVLPYCDIVFGSRIDAMALGEAFEWPEQSLPQVMSRIVSLNKHNLKRPRIVVITGGSESTYVATVDGVTEYDVPPIDIEKIVDTNGAGDAFVGGFLSQYMQHKSIEMCIKGAHAAAQEVIQHNGCTFGDVPPNVDD